MNEFQAAEFIDKKDRYRLERFTGMDQFQWIEGVSDDTDTVTSQFNEWFGNEQTDFSYFKVTDFKILSGINSSNQRTETLYVLFEYEF